MRSSERRYLQHVVLSVVVICGVLCFYTKQFCSGGKRHEVGKRAPFVPTRFASARNVRFVWVLAPRSTTIAASASCFRSVGLERDNDVQARAIISRGTSASRSGSGIGSGTALCF